MAEFAIGNIVTTRFENDIDYVIGTVVDIKDSHGATIICVEWRDPITCGHDCDGKCKYGHGWNFLASDLVPISPKIR